MTGTDWPAATPLATRRLDLEPLTVTHATEMGPLLDDAALHTYTGGRPLAPDQLAARYARQVVGRSDDGREGWLNWVVRRRDTGRAVGYLQVTLVENGGTARAELAWVVAVDQQRRGFATEAATAVAEWLGRADVTALTAHIHPDHVGSENVARRLGLRPTEERRDGEVRWVRAVGDG